MFRLILQEMGDSGGYYRMGLENNTIVCKLFFKSLPDSCEEDGIRDTENVDKILRQESVAPTQEMLTGGNPNRSSRVKQC